MAKEWSDEEVQAAISDAVRIVREDRFEAFVRGRVSPPNDDNGGANPPPSGGSNPDPNGAPPKRKSLWWGETDE